MALINTQGSSDLLSGLIALLSDPKAFSEKLQELQTMQDKTDEKLKEFQKLNADLNTRQADLEKGEKLVIQGMKTNAEQAEINAKDISDLMDKEDIFAQIAINFEISKKAFDDFKTTELQKIKDENSRVAGFLKETIVKDIELKKLAEGLTIREELLVTAEETLKTRIIDHEAKLAKLKSLSF